MKKKLFRILLVVLIVMGMIPTSTFTTYTANAESSSVFLDMPEDWSTTALENAVKNGLLSGYDGKILPKDNLTRAQMAAIMNRAFGSKEVAPLESYTDVAESAWYYSDMAKAVQMKTFVGSDDKLNPDDYITREEAFTVLARAFKLSKADESVPDRFSDKALVSDWAKYNVASLVNSGYIEGSNGKLNPKKNITRAEFAQLMDNMIKNYIKESGTYTEDLDGNVMINVPDVTLKDMKITGDLIIGDGVGDGDVTLDSIVVTGRTVIRGGGEHSIRIIGDSSIQNITIARVDGKVRVYTEDGLEIGETIVDGSDDVIIEGDMGTVTVVASNVTVTATGADIEAGVVEGNNSKIIVSQNSAIKKAEINGEDSRIIVEEGSEIEAVTVNGRGADISGEGRIDKVEAKADDITVSTPGTKVTAKNGTKGIKAGNISVGEGNTETVPGNEENSGSSRRRSSGQPTTSSLATYTAITFTQTGDAANDNVQYQDAAAVMSALPAEINVTLEDTSNINVPVTWTDTDTYNASIAGDYTFTAAWGQMPAGADNNSNLSAPTVEVTVAAGLAPTPAEYFMFDPNTGTITGYDPAGGTDVVIPEKINGVTVEHIGDRAFSSIGYNSISIQGRPSGGQLTSVVIPDTVVSIGYRAFSSHQLSSITIPDSVITIGERAFSNNPLTEVYISKSVTGIGSSAFYRCMELVGFNVADENNSYSSADGVLFNKDQTILIQYPCKKSGSYSIPQSVTAIGEAAFSYCTELTGITLPDGLTSIGDEAFYQCEGLAGITLPDSLTFIGYAAFYDCTRLTGSIVIPDGVTSIESSAFSNCTELESLTIGDGVNSIRSFALYNCSKLTNVTIGSSVANIGMDAFSECAKLEAFVVNPDNNDFSSLDGVLFNKNGTILLQYPCGKAGDYVIPDGAITIGNAAFFQCVELTGVSFPDSMNNIEQSAFQDCAGLTEVIIPSNIAGIDSYAFSGTNLVRITIERNDTSIGNSAFTGYDHFRTAYVAGGAGTYTRSGSIWGKIVGHIYQIATEADATISGGADICFSNNESLEGVSHSEGNAVVAIVDPGTYRVDYSVRTDGAIGAEIALTVNGTVVDGTGVPVTDGTGSAELYLNNGDAITLRNNSASSFDLALSPETGAEIFFVKID